MNIKRYMKSRKLIKGRVLRGGIKMAVLAKGKPIMFSIKKELAREFIEDSNKNVITEGVLNKWKKETEIFRKRL